MQGMVDERQDANAVPADARMVTMKDIAQRCGVGLVTVSRALHRDPAVKAETARAILAVAEELGYDLNYHLAARRLALRKHGHHVVNHVITLFLSGDALQSSFFTHVFRGILSMSASQGFALLTADHFMEAGQPANLPIYTRGEVDGFLAFGWMFHHLQPFLSRLAHQSRPFPVVTMMEQQPGCSTVLVDDFGGAYAATTHLLELGHRHILHFWSLDPLTANTRVTTRITPDRAQGCRQACLDRGLNPDQVLHVSYTSGRISLHQRLALPLTAMLDEHPEITAILLPNDSFIGQAREVLLYRGMRIPGEMSVVGFDDVETLNNESGENILTTVSVPLEELGRQAAKLLIDQVNGRCQETTCLTLPTRLEVRGSTAPPR